MCDLLLERSPYHRPLDAGDSKRIIEAWIEASRNRQDSDSLVVYDGTKAVGIYSYSASSTDSEHMEGRGICVKEEYRGKGIGSFLRDIVFDHLKREKKNQSAQARHH